MSYAMSFDQVIEALKVEREYQKYRWGYRQADGSFVEPSHGVGDFLVYAQDYLTAAVHRASRENGNAGAIEELRKVMALCCACFEMNGGLQTRDITNVINARDGLIACDITLPVRIDQS